MSDHARPRVKTQNIPRAAPLRIRIRPEQLALARRQEQESRPAEVDAGSDVGELRGVYIISVAARLLEMHPQTLRKYERLGLVRPYRTIGMLRLYSQEDIEKLRLIRHLEENLGLNLAGVEFTLALLGQLMEMRRRLGTIKEAERFSTIVEQEMTQLFGRLNLTLQD